MNDTGHPAAIAITAAASDAANVLRVPIDQITVESLEAREWSDSCLGLPEDGEACLDVITPGYLIVLGDGFSYRTDMLGNIRREIDIMDRELRVHFRQSGGLGGWTSDYHADDASLSASEVAQIRRFIDETDFFSLPSEVSNGDPITDLFSYTIFLAHGRRNHTVRTYDGGGPAESPALMQFIDWLKERAPAPGREMVARTAPRD